MERSGIGLQCFTSYCLVKCGVPQGSALGPILFPFSMLPLQQIIYGRGMFFHFYADDAPMFLPIRSWNAESLCDVINRHWVSGHRKFGLLLGLFSVLLSSTTYKAIMFFSPPTSEPSCPLKTQTVIHAFFHPQSCYLSRL